MKILLTGKHGQVGFELQRALAVLGEVVAVDQADCDLADAAAIRALVRSVQPTAIISPAAYTAVDKAESEIDLARAINAVAPGVFGAEAEKLGALVLHYSTDYVFDGTLDRPYVESDATHPQGVYGLTKRDGEVALAAATPRHVILRTSWVVGAHGGNFAKTMLRLAAERDSLNVVADQWGAPTSAALLADVTAHLLRQWQAASERFPYGLYHCAAGGQTNWCDYARYVVEQAVQAGKPIKATPDKIQAITTADYPTPAKRPANSRLNCTKFKQTFGLELPHWQAGLSHILHQIL
jgi:dTDP-4-dehydrorhamnose reductase